MINQQDNGYISNFLIHWTGKNGDEKGSEILTEIISTCRLLLSNNSLHVFDTYNATHVKMVCFTDVPLVHSEQHCNRYGHFGIAFKKLPLMNVGAQPVFYASHCSKQDMNIIFKFLQEQIKNTTIENTLFRALHRHFYHIQKFSDGQADQNNTYYYEREWRLGEQSLVPQEKLNRENPKYNCQQEGYQPCTGRLEKEGDKSYFGFDKEHIAFIIAPQNHLGKFQDVNGFQAVAYENLVHKKLDTQYGS